MSEYINIQTVQMGNQVADHSNALPSARFGSGTMSYDVPAEDSGSITGNHQTPAFQHNLGGTLTLDGGGSLSRSIGAQTFSTSELTGGQTGFLGTAHNNGSPAMGNLKPTSTVQYGGMEVELQTLEGMGIVQRTATGYVVVGGQQGTSPFPAEAAQPVAQEQEQQQQDDQPQLPPGVELFSPEVEAEVLEAAGHLDIGSYTATSAAIIENGMDGVNWNDLAAISGITPQEARSRAEMIDNAFTQQIIGIAQSSGITDLEAAQEWAMTHRPEQFNDARRQLAIGRNPSALRSLIKEYRASVPPTVEALQRSGFKTQTTPGGESLVFVKGTWTTPAAAARAGWL